jgi:phage anti-repressor protein
MSTLPLIPVTPAALGGQAVQLVDARLLHRFLEVGRDFTNWIKGHIGEYGFEADADYLLAKTGEQVPHQGGQRAVTRVVYLLTLDTAKELAMVERTPRGRLARRYFIECERQLRQLRETQAGLPSASDVPLTRGQRQAINRQAWADVAAKAHAAFHSRREILVRQYVERSANGPVYLPMGYRPSWAIDGGEV